MGKSTGSGGVLARALKERSSIHAHLRPGRQGMGTHSDRVTEATFVVIDSVDFDEATRPLAPTEARWDYFLGARPKAKSKSGDCIVGIEVHSATDREVAVVIAKKQASSPRLLAELRPDAPSRRWVWIASGKVRFSPNSKYRRRLAEARIEFPGRHFTL